MSFAAASERPRRRIRVRSRKPPPEAPKLARLYAEALPAPNIFARFYLYEFLVRFEDLDALGWPTARLDAVHCWDAFFVQQLLQRIAMHLAGLSTLDSGQPAAGFARLVRALRRHAHDPDTPAPWTAAEALLAHAQVPACTLEAVDVAMPVWRRAAKRAPEPVGPRRTRSTTRLVDAVAALESHADTEAHEPGTRRSRRAEQLAAKKRHDDLRQKAERVLGPTVWDEEASEAEEADDDPGAPMHLEEKIACLVRLCDLLAVPRGVPASSGLHRLVQPLIEGLPQREKEARDRILHTQATCDASMKSAQKRAPSMVSAHYEAWQDEVRRSLTQRKQLAQTHEHAVQSAQAEQYVTLRRHSPRSGSLGRDLDGNEYWHLCPVVPPHDAFDVCAAGATPRFSGHWSQVLVVYGHAPGGELGDDEAEGAAQDAPQAATPSARQDAPRSQTPGAPVPESAAPSTTAPASPCKKARIEAGSSSEPSAPGFFGTQDAGTIKALHAYLRHRMERAELSEEAAADQAALLANVARVQTYMAWAAAEKRSRAL